MIWPIQKFAFELRGNVGYYYFPVIIQIVHIFIYLLFFVNYSLKRSKYIFSLIMYIICDVHCHLSLIFVFEKCIPTNFHNFL